MRRRAQRSARLLLAATALVLCPGASSLADERCAYPPPVIHCEDWRRGENGLLIAKKDLVIGLMQIEKGHYIGGGIRIAGYDYGALLRRQCGPAPSFWRRWFGIGD